MAAFTLQFRNFTTTEAPEEAETPLPSNIVKYLQEFDAELSDEEISSPHFRRRFLFVPVVTSKKTQADEVIEFVRADSELGKSINDSYQKVLLKEVERPKQLPGQIVKLIHEEGYDRFSMHHHTRLWKILDAKNPGKGYGVLVAKTWYWYDRWLDVVRSHCVDNETKYASEIAP